MWEHFAKSFITLFAIVDPIACVPILLAMAPSATARARAALVASVTACLALVFFAVLGRHVLLLFGVSIAAFQVAGGMLLFFIALSMMQAEMPRAVRSPGDEADMLSKAGEIGVVPLAIPLLAGPAAMTNVVLMGNGNGDSAAMWATSVAAIVAVAAASWLILSKGALIVGRLGPVWLNAATRALGLVLAALSVEIFAAGVSTLFPVLSGR